MSILRWSALIVIGSGCGGGSSRDDSSGSCSPTEASVEIEISAEDLAPHLADGELQPIECEQVICADIDVESNWSDQRVLWCVHTGTADSRLEEVTCRLEGQPVCE